MVLTLALIAFSLFDGASSMQHAATVEAETFYEQTKGNGTLTIRTISTPEGISVPRGATNVRVGTIEFIADCSENIRVHTIPIIHKGIGAASDIERIYLNEGFRRITRSKPFDRSSGAARLSLKDFVINACDTRTLDIVVDIHPNASVANAHSFTSGDAKEYETSARTITIEDQAKNRQLVTTAQNQGKISVEYLNGTTSARFGRQETLLRIRLSADIKNSHYLKGVTFTNTENARDRDLLDLSLQTTKGTTVTTPRPWMNGREISFTFEPELYLERGQSTLLLLKGTMNASSSKRISLTILEPSDLKSTIARKR